MTSAKVSPTSTLQSLPVSKRQWPLAPLKLLRVRSKCSNARKKQPEHHVLSHPLQALPVAAMRVGEALHPGDADVAVPGAEALMSAPGLAPLPRQRMEQHPHHQRLRSPRRILLRQHECIGVSTQHAHAANTAWIDCSHDGPLRPRSSCIYYLHGHETLPRRLSRIRPWLWTGERAAGPIRHAVWFGASVIT